MRIFWIILSTVDFKTFVRLTVSSIGLLDTPIIGDILSLSIDPVEAEAQLRQAVVSVLLDYTFGFFDVLFFGHRVPPIHQVSCKNESSISFFLIGNFLMAKKLLS